MVIAGRIQRYIFRQCLMSLGLTLGGPLAVLIAAFIVESLPLFYVRWLVVVVVVYTASMMLRSTASERKAAAARAAMTTPPGH